MTTINKKRLTCAVCGKKSEYLLLSSTNSTGADLDLRPCGMMRSTLGSEIQVCPHCKYVAYDIEKPVPESVRAYVQSLDYNKSISSGSFFGFAESEQYCNLTEIGLIIEDYEMAFFAQLKAAWISDDLHKKEEAVKFRKRALELIQLIPDTRMDRDTRFLLSADLFRRTRNFEDVIRICNEYKADSDFVTQQLIYENELAKIEDDCAHQLRSPSIQ